MEVGEIRQSQPAEANVIGGRSEFTRVVEPSGTLKR